MQINYNSLANMSNINSRRMMRNNNNQKVILPQINPNQNKTPKNSLPATPSTPQSPQKYSTHFTDKQKQQ